VLVSVIPYYIIMNRKYFMKKMGKKSSADGFVFADGGTAPGLNVNPPKKNTILIKSNLLLLVLVLLLNHEHRIQSKCRLRLGF
jgi:hypothetical protein